MLLSGSVLSLGSSMSIISKNAEAKISFDTTQPQFNSAELLSDNLILTFNEFKLNYKYIKEVDTDIKIDLYIIVDGESYRAKRIPVSIQSESGTLDIAPLTVNIGKENNGISLSSADTITMRLQIKHPNIDTMTKLKPLVTPSATQTETFDNGTISFDNVDTWSEWTGDTGLVSTTSTNKISGSHSLTVSQPQDMRVIASFTSRPRRLTYKSYYEWNNSGFGDSSRDTFEDGSGNRIFSFQHLPPLDNTVDNEIVANNKSNILIDGVDNKKVRDYVVEFDWDNEQVFVSVDGNSGTFPFVSSPQDTGFKFEFRGEADGWDFVRRYDDIKFEY